MRDRLLQWFQDPNLIRHDPKGIGGLAARLPRATPDSTGCALLDAETGRRLAAVNPYGSLAGFLTRAPFRRFLEFDRLGHLLTVIRWEMDQQLGWAKLRNVDGQWLGIEPRAAHSPIWGGSDRLWLVEPEAPFTPIAPVTTFQSVNYGAIAFIPSLAEPRRLPPGAGTTVLNLLASLLVDQGTARVRYRGPYPTEQLFTALLESFRYDPAVESPLERFSAAAEEAALAGQLVEAPLDWIPAPHERLFLPDGGYVRRGAKSKRSSSGGGPTTAASGSR